VICYPCSVLLRRIILIGIVLIGWGITGSVFALEYHPVVQCRTRVLPEIPDNPGVRRAAVAADRIVSRNRMYRKGMLSLPQLVYLDDGRAQTLALVYKPEHWDEFEPEKRKAIFTLHGLCGNAADHFDLWQELAEEKQMMLISLQWWLEDNLPPRGYTVFYDQDRPCGYKLDVRQDIFSFMNTLFDEYDVNSAMIHGSAVSAPMSVILAYRDKLKNNRVDMSLFDAGHIEGDSPMRREMERALRAHPDTPPLKGEQFFFFYDSDMQYNNTHEFVAKYGGNILDVVTGNGEHGVLFTDKSENLRRRIVDTYDALAMESHPVH